MNLQIKWPASLQGKGKIEKVESQKPSILLVGGMAVQELLQEWMSQLNDTRSTHGSNHYNPEKVLDPIVEGNYVFVPITIPGISRALHDIVIRPVEAQALAIPLHADAYGISPREYNDTHPQGHPDALFKPKDKDYLAKNDGGELVVMYLLRSSVHQKKDRTLLPPADNIINAFNEAVGEAVEAVLQS